MRRGLHGRSHVKLRQMSEPDLRRPGIVRLPVPAASLRSRSPLARTPASASERAGPRPSRRLTHQAPAAMATDAGDATQPMAPFVLDAVLKLLVSDDARDACAAACVCTAWSRAAAAPAVWRHIRLVSPHPRCAAPLTDARLAKLVARAAGDLRSLDVAGCVELTNAGIVAALSHLTSLRRVALCRTPPPASKYELPRKEWIEVGFGEEEVDYNPPYQRPERAITEHELGPTLLNSRGIAAALRASAPLEDLRVDGFLQVHMALPYPNEYRTFPNYTTDDAANDDLATLLPLVVGDAERLDVVLCGSVGPYWAFESCAAGEELNHTATTKQTNYHVPHNARCHTLQTRAEAVFSQCCQGCFKIGCAHVPGLQVTKCACKEQMCEDCREDCQAYR